MFNKKESLNCTNLIYSTLTTPPSTIFSMISKALWQVLAESRAMAVVFLTIVLSDYGCSLRGLARPFYTILCNKVAKPIPLSLTNSISKHNLFLNRL